MILWRTGEAPNYGKQNRGCHKQHLLSSAYRAAPFPTWALQKAAHEGTRAWGMQGRGFIKPSLTSEGTESSWRVFSLLEEPCSCFPEQKFRGKNWIDLLPPLTENTQLTHNFVKFQQEGFSILFVPNPTHYNHYLIFKTLEWNNLVIRHHLWKTVTLTFLCCWVLVHINTVLSVEEKIFISASWKLNHSTLPEVSDQKTYPAISLKFLSSKYKKIQLENPGYFYSLIISWKCASCSCWQRSLGSGLHTSEKRPGGH